jgi:hypothetical protein
MTRALALALALGLAVEAAAECPPDAFDAGGQAAFGTAFTDGNDGATGASGIEVDIAHP